MSRADVSLRAKEAVVTFDPAHGSTCHPAHRALGTLVLDACAGESRCLAVVLVETSATFAGSDVTIGPAIESGTGDALLFDVSAFWHYMTEDMALQGRAPYDVSKSCADLIAVSYAHTFGTPVAITRDRKRHV